MGFRLVLSSMTLNDHNVHVYRTSLPTGAVCVKLNEDRPNDPYCQRQKDSSGSVEYCSNRA